MEQAIIIETILSNMECSDKAVIRLLMKDKNSFIDLISMIESTEMYANKPVGSHDAATKNDQVQDDT